MRTNDAASRERRALASVRLTEAQAIAIYRAEIWALKRTAWTAGRRECLRLCEEILAEEIEHLGWIDASPGASAPSSGRSAFESINQFGGVCLGLALAALPARLSFAAHAAAELQAERAYLIAAGEAWSETTRKALLRAASQEREHSRRFQSAAKNAAARGRSPARAKNPEENSAS